MGYLCYFIYNITEDKKLDIVAIGDEIANNPYFINYSNSTFNSDFTNNYHVNDLLNIIKYNEEISINDKAESIHQLLNKSDILIISIGMNDIYYKLNDDVRETYTYLNTIVNNYEIILNEISKYNYKQVYILGYYSIDSKKSDLFTYINYKLTKITNKYQYTYVDLNKIVGKNTEYYLKNNDFSLNNKGYYQIFKFIVENLKKS